MQNLAELYVTKSELPDIKNSTIELKRWDLTPRQICDLEWKPMTNYRII